MQVRRRLNRTISLWLCVPALVLTTGLLAWKSRPAKPRWPPVMPPNYIQPVPRSYSRGVIYDFVLTGDWRTDGNVSVAFIAEAGLDWPWSSFTCRFRHGGAASNGSFTLRFTNRMRDLACPVPESVLRALRRGRILDVRFSVYPENSEGRTAILEDVVVMPRAKARHALAVQTEIKDEAATIVEWLEYHHSLLGIPHFYIYDNNSTDGVRKVLQPYMEGGIVTLIEWPFLPERPANAPADFKAHWLQVQRAAVNHALKSFGGVTRWMGLFDVDEYFQLNDTHANAVDCGDTTLVQLLDGRPTQDGEPWAALQLENWQIFCDLDMRAVRNARATLLIEKCRQIDPARAADRPKLQKLGKMWVRCAAVPAMYTIHHLTYLKLPLEHLAWPDFGRLRHYRAYWWEGKGALEFDGGPDESFDRYIAPLRRHVTARSSI